MTKIQMVPFLWGVFAWPALAGYPFLATEEECSSMKPSSLETRPNYDSIYNRPFHIDVSDTIYGLMHHVKVSVSKKGNKTIMGIFLQARLTECADSSGSRPYGEFELLDGDQKLEFVNCDGRSKNGVVNKDFGRPYDRIDVNFSVDKKEKRRIHFIATVVTLGDEVWMGLTSKTIRHFSGPTRKTKCSIISKLSDPNNNTEVTRISILKVFLLTIFVLLNSSL